MPMCMWLQSVWEVSNVSKGVCYQVMGAVRMGRMLSGLGDRCQIWGWAFLGQGWVLSGRWVGVDGVDQWWRPELRNIYLLFISGLWMGGCWHVLSGSGWVVSKCGHRRVAFIFGWLVSWLSFHHRLLLCGSENLRQRIILDAYSIMFAV